MRTGEQASGLHFLGAAQFPTGYSFDATTVGGLSGISYDAGGQVHYAISDDRSTHNPARFYTVRVPLSDNGIGDIQFVGTHPLLDPAGRPFAQLAADAQPPVIPPDPEGIAFDARRQQLYWCSEGERRTDAPGGPLLLNPWIRVYPTSWPSATLHSLSSNGHTASATWRASTAPRWSVPMTCWAGHPCGATNPER